MAGLSGKTISQSYKSLLRVKDDTNGVRNALNLITDGEGTEAAMSISDDAVRIQPRNDDTSALFAVRQQGGTNILQVDSTIPAVKTGVNLNFVNTQYAYFGVNNIDSADFTDDTHMAIPFNGNGYGDLDNIPAFGTGADPATTFSTSAGAAVKASDLVPCIWHVQDDITIDSLTLYIGADAATGDTCRFHLMSYTFSSGSTSALTSGAILASSADNTNSGVEQAYKLTISPTIADVDAGKVILGCFRSDSINSDYSINLTVKYHLR